jgi:BirA family biotin operon repressor/biotin-[acetyl-CoA-carboxylase] ligase
MEGVLVTAEPANVALLRALLAADQALGLGELQRHCACPPEVLLARIQQLQQAGYGLSLSPSDAVSLGAFPQSLHPAGLVALWTLLNEGKRSSVPKLYFADSLGSTNDAAAQLLKEGAAVPLLVVAARQTRGRGRMGRTWHSEDAGNLYASFGFAPKLKPSALPCLTLWVAYQLAQRLRKQYQVPVCLKWPNDLWVHGSKLAGLLTETKLSRPEGAHLVLGLGLNLNGDLSLLPSEVRAKATTLADQLMAPLDQYRAAACILDCVATAYRTFHDDPATSMSHLQANWGQVCALKDRQVEAHAAKGCIRGEAVGLAEDGALILKLAGGQQQRIYAGEVTLHPSQ